MLRNLVNGTSDSPVDAAQWARSLGIALFVGVAYFFAAQLGLALLTAAERVAVFWPASGIAAGTLIALGSWARAPVSLAVVGASAAAGLLTERNIWSALAFGVCDAGEALLAAWLIKRWFGSAYNLDGLIRVVGLFAAGAIATAIGAAGASAAMMLLGPSTASFRDIWEVWFASDTLGIISVAPLLIGIAAAVREPPPRGELFEGTLAVAAMAVVCGFVLALLAGPRSLVSPTLFFFPLLLWLGSRCRPVFASAASFIVAAAVVWTTIYEWGRYGDPSQPIADRVLAAQSTILGTALTALALAGIFAERRRHELAARENEARLRSILDAANVLAWEVDLVRNAVHSAGPARRFLDRPNASVPPDFAAMVETIHPVDRDSVMSRFWTAVSTDRNFRLEFRLNSDALRWVTAEGLIERDVDGRPVRVRGITHDITERKEAEKQQSLLIAELDHRVKNVLATVAVVTKRTSEHTTSTSDFIDALDQRLQSMGAAHSLLSLNRWRDVSLADLIAEALGPYAASGNAIVEGPPVYLTAAATQAMAMVLHELATNAAKYGALSTAQGQVSVRWHLVPGGEAPFKLRLEWRETGGPAVTPPTRVGFGTSVIRDLIPYELGGGVELEYRQNGVSSTIEIALQSATGHSTAHRIGSQSSRSGAAS